MSTSNLNTYNPLSPSNPHDLPQDLPQGLPQDLSVYMRQQKPLWNVAAIAYTLGGYYGGVYLLLLTDLGWNLLGVFLLTHALVLSAYLSHEFMHGTIFNNMKTNHLWGNVMQWLHGTSYIRFQTYAQGHIDHHIKGVDLYVLDRVTMINSLPAALRWLIVNLERFYFPALFLMRQFAGIGILYRDAACWQARLRVVTVALLRIAMFALLGWLSLKALFLYLFAFIGAVQIVMLMDCLQHTYELYPIGSVIPKKDRAYEQANTFSTPVSRRFPWLNLLLLNFSYHNAHHAVMKCPWYNLPELDRVLAQQQTVHHISLLQVLKNYHQFRLRRLFDPDEGSVTVDEQGNLQLDQFYGVAGGTSLLLA